jgi:crossover junction endodeoxyribonuclease RuvC
MRVLGVDPGLRNMGWGVIEAVGSRITHVANGVCHSTGEDLATRLVSLYTQMTAVVQQYQPDAAAVENTFVNKDGVGNPETGSGARNCPVGSGTGGHHRLPEYAPNKVKKTIVGVGHADKGQIDHMVRLQLPGVQIAGADAADALAIALCHAHYARSAGAWEAALAKAQ